MCVGGVGGVSTHLKCFLLTPLECSFLVCRDLNLRKPIYQNTACYGHFGRDEFPWEHPKNLKI